MKRRLLVPLLCFLLALGVLPAAAQTEPYRIIYDDDDAAQQSLDVYLPEGGGRPYPTLVMIHGGGFFAGDLDTLAPLARYFQAEGFAVVNITYRLLPDGIFPYPVEDATCALAWVITNGEAAGLDTTRLFILGESAGGYLAAILAHNIDTRAAAADCPLSLRERPPLMGAVAYFPIVDFTADDFQPVGFALGAALFGENPLLLGTGERERITQTLASIAAQRGIHARTPPFLLIHGEDDPIVPPSQSILLADALAAADVPNEVLLIPDAGHGFAAQVERPAGAKAAQAALSFMRALLDG